MIFTNAQLIKIGEWVKKNFSNGEYYFSFTQGFEGRYILVKAVKDCQEGQLVYNLNDIF